MSTQPRPDVPDRSTLDLVREMRQRNAHSRERVLRSIERLRQIAQAKRQRRR
jgi:hypothetical protein